jgi:hypothetical protein
MKFIRISDITSASAAKIKSGTIDHMQSSWIEMSLSLGRSLIGEAYDSTKNYILYGCENTGAGLNYIISAGAIFTNGEIFQVAAKTFSVSGGQVAFFYGVEVPVTATNADPVTFTDASTHNIHIDRKGDWYGAATSGSALEFTNLIRVVKLDKSTLAAGAHYTASSTYCQKNRDGLVTLRGTLTGGASAVTSDSATILPSGYRPPTTLYFTTIIYKAGTGASMVYLQILSTGDIVMLYSSAGTLVGYELDLCSLPSFYNY